MQGGHELRQVVNARAELPVELVHGLGGQRVVVDGLDGGAEGVGEEQVALAVAQEVLEPLVSAVTGAAAAAGFAGGAVTSVFGRSKTR